MQAEPCCIHLVSSTTCTLTLTLASPDCSLSNPRRAQRGGRGRRGMEEEGGPGGPWLSPGASFGAYKDGPLCPPFLTFSSFVVCAFEDFTTLALYTSTTLSHLVWLVARYYHQLHSRPRTHLKTPPRLRPGSSPIENTTIPDMKRSTETTDRPPSMKFPRTCISTVKSDCGESKFASMRLPL